MSFDPVSPESDPPDLDDRLVEPGTRYEMLDGELVYVPPADAPHARRQAQLCALIEAHVRDEFDVASELLTRTSKDDDFAPDVSIYLKARDPRGKRQLAQLVFEVVSTQTLSNAAKKAAKLATRGVRRIVAIDVGRSRALEWSAGLGTWSVLETSGHIVDPVLEVPLPMEMLIREARTDDAVARALMARRNPAFEAVSASTRAEGRAEGLAEGRAEGLAEGRAGGLAEAVLSILVGRNMAPDREARQQIVAERDLARLHRWLDLARTCRSVAELFEAPPARNE